MSSVTVFPGKANGVITAPASVDEALRALIMAAVTKRSVHGIGGSEEAIAMLGALKAIGASFRRQDGTITFYTTPAARNASIDLGNSQETLLLILPLCLSLGGSYTFIFNKKQKLEDILLFLKSEGIKYSLGAGSLFISGTFCSKEFIKNIPISFVCGILMAMPLADSARVVYENAEKDDYLLMTLDIMEKFGQNVSSEKYYHIFSTVEKPLDYCYRAGGDYEAASYYMLAGLFSGSVGITGLISDCFQPQKRVINLLSENNLNIEERNGAVFAKKSRITAFDADASLYAHSIPMIAALLCVSNERCVIKNADLPQNNNDEITNIAGALRAIGADISIIGGDMIICGKKKLFGGTARSFGSERIAMALGALALCCENPVTIDLADTDQAICEDFFKSLSALGVLVQ